VRGLNALRIRLGVVQPGEQPVAGVHICPDSSLDVPDEQAVRLVVLGPKEGFASSAQDCAAMRAVCETLENRGTSPRTWRNMLVFLAPEQSSLSVLEQEVRRYLAWKSIQSDSQDLNLDAAQNRETEHSLKRSDETVELRLKEVWCWLLVPSIDRSDMKTLEWESTRLSGNDDSIVSRVARKLLQNEQVITKWAPALLLMELDNLLWRGVESLQIRQLWEYLCKYCYLPRLADYSVLEEAIQIGLPSGEYFGYAAAVGEGRFIDLKYAQPAQTDRSGFLVKAEAARKQKKQEQAAQTGTATGQASGNTSHTGGGYAVTSDETKISGSDGVAEPAESYGTTPTQPASPKPMRFYLSTRLDNTRVNRDVQKILEEIVAHLSQEGSVDLELRLEIQATAANGIGQQTVRAVSENCRTLKITNFGFEER